MTTRTYLAAVCGSEGNYGIVFRDFPGCTSAAETLEQVPVMAREALGGHIAVGLDHGDHIPEPTEHSLSDVAVEFDDPDDPIDETWVALVPVTVDVPPPEDSVLVRLPRALVDEVVARDVATGRFIADAVRQAIARLSQAAE